jgi:hypothetical protein
MMTLDRLSASEHGVFTAQPIKGLAFQAIYNASQAGAGQYLSAITFDATITLLADFTEKALSDFIGSPQIHVDGVALEGDAHAQWGSP